MKSLSLDSTIPKPYKPSPPLDWPPHSGLLPTKPGVYWFKNSKNQILYIGKAKNLKSRLSSYRLNANQVGKTKLLLNQAKFIQFALLPSELLALILEAHLIKTFIPKYNIRLKDDRSPLYIVITDEPYPRVLTTRKSQLVNSKLPIVNSYGPFPSGFKASQILKTLRRIFPFCNASPRDKTLHKVCFYNHIGLCTGACSGSVTRRKYLYMIKNLGRFLTGDEDKVITSLNRKMRTYSKNQQYEAATGIRNQLSLIEAIKHKRLSQADKDELSQSMVYASQLQSLKTLLKLKKLPRRIETYDIATLSGKHSTGSMVVFVNAKPSPADYRHFKIRSFQTPNDVAMMAEVVKRRIRHPEWPTPNVIVVDGGKPQVNIIKQALANREPWQQIPVIGIAKRLEELIITNQVIRLPRTSPVLKLIQNTRDEAHRFSRRLHKRLRQKHLLATD